MTAVLDMSDSAIKTVYNSCAKNFAQASALYQTPLNLSEQTNCLSYALGIPDAGMAVIGHLSNPNPILYHTMMYAEKIHELMEADGLVEIRKRNFSACEGQIIAVMIKEYHCGHVYKYHKDGTWSHQAGMGGEITNLDCDGQIITDLETANTGFYDELVGYYKMPDAGLRYLTCPKAMQSLSL
tara:strand:+ start:103396 stop:103944 length:549 start_codon:yes stop_codon:yes gene_type:complete